MPLKVFVGWSKARSRQMADALYHWLPEMLQGVQPWLSNEDISPGRRWAELTRLALEGHETALFCVTPENVDEPWLCFESGMIARSNSSRVIMLLLDDRTQFSPTHPLRTFQAVYANHEGLARICATLHEDLRRAGVASPAFDDGRRQRTYSRLWPELDARLAEIRGGHAPSRVDPPPPPVDVQLAALSQTVDVLSARVARLLDLVPTPPPRTPPSSSHWDVRPVSEPEPDEHPAGDARQALSPTDPAAGGADP